MVWFWADPYKVVGVPRPPLALSDVSCARMDACSSDARIVALAWSTIHVLSLFWVSELLTLFRLSIHVLAFCPTPYNNVVLPMDFRAISQNQPNCDRQCLVAWVWSFIFGHERHHSRLYASAGSGCFQGHFGKGHAVGNLALWVHLIIIIITTRTRLDICLNQFHRKSINA